MRNKYKLAAGLLALAMAGSVAAGIAFADDSTSTTTTTTTQGKLGSKFDAIRQKLRQTKAEAINKLAVNQLNRAQKAFDRLSNVLTRLEALRAKMAASTSTNTSTTTGTDNTSTSTNTSTNTSTSTSTNTKATVNLAAIDTLITKAEAQKTTAQKDIDDLKVKVASLQSALTTAANSTSTSTTVAPTHPVQDFMKSIRTLKNDLIAWHKNLQQIVADMKAMNGQDQTDNQNQNENDQNKSGTTTNTNTSTNSTTTTNAGSGENQ